MMGRKRRNLKESDKIIKRMEHIKKVKEIVLDLWKRWVVNMVGLEEVEGNGNPVQYSCLENSMDGGAWWATQSMESQRVGDALVTSLMPPTRWVIASCNQTYWYFCSKIWIFTLSGIKSLYITSFYIMSEFASKWIIEAPFVFQSFLEFGIADKGLWTYIIYLDWLLFFSLVLIIFLCSHLISKWLAIISNFMWLKWKLSFSFFKIFLEVLL